MFTLIAKVADVLSNFGFRFLDARKAAKDVPVARELASVILFLQDICVRGERVLRLAGEIFGGGVDDDHSMRFEKLVSEQAEALGELQRLLDEKRPLLATVDAGLYLELAPLLDQKSGVLTRWRQQVSQSRFSTTTLFFLPRNDVDEIVTVGRAELGESGLDDRTSYVIATSDAVKAIRADEVRDIRSATEGDRPKLEPQLHDARTELDRAKQMCTSLLDSITTAVGADALAGLRRDLVKHPD